MAQMEKPTNFKVPGKKNLIKAFPLQRLKEESEIETFLVQHKYQYTMVVSRVRKYNSIYSSQVCAYLKWSKGTDRKGQYQ